VAGPLRLRVVSFLNYRSPDGSDPSHAQASEARARFGGPVAPTLQLALDGTTLIVDREIASVTQPI
jgi:hypothetical protein